MHLVNGFPLFLLILTSSLAMASDTKDDIKIAIQSIFMCNPEKCVEYFIPSPDLGIMALSNGNGKEGIPELKDIKVLLTLETETGGAFVSIRDSRFGVALRNINGNWKIDPKYFIKTIDDINSHRIKSLLYFCLTHDEENIKRIIVNKENSHKLIIGNKAPGGDVDVLQEYIAQATVIRVKKGGNYVSNGKVAINNDFIPENKKALYSVLYSDIEFSVFMVRGENGWLIEDSLITEDIIKIRKSQMPSLQVAEKQSFNRFTAHSIRNKTDKDIEVSISDGKNMTGSVFIGSGAGATEGFGPLKLENGISLDVKFGNENSVSYKFDPDIKSIKQKGKYATLVFLIYGKDKVKMGYEIDRESPDRPILIIVGENGKDAALRNANEDLVYFSAWGTLEQVKVAFDMGADINSRNDFGMSPVMMATMNGKIDIIKYLMTKEPNMTYKNGNKENVYEIAKGKKDILTILGKQ